MVIAGSFVNLTVLSMFSLGYSILFSDFLLSRGVSSTTIAWIFNIHLFLWNAVGVVIGPLTKELGFRTVSMFAAGLAALSLFLLVFADSVWYLMVFFGFGGLFGGMGAKPSYLLLTLYFDRKRGLANAFLMSGVCVAQFVGPLLIRYLLAEYSLKGATLILSGVVLHSVMGASLFQPVEWHLKEDDGLESLKGEVKEDKNANEDLLKSDPDAGVTDEMRAKEAERRKRLGVSLSRRPSEISMLSLAVSNIDLSSIPPSSRRGSCALENTTFTRDDDSDRSSSVRGFLKASVRVLNAVISDMKILKSPRAVIIVLGAVFIVNGYVNFLMTAPFAIQHLGYSLSEAAWCMSLAAIANFAARLITSGLSDKPWFNIRLVFMTGACIICVTSIVFGFLENQTLIQVTMAVWGCGVGINISLIVLIMPRFMGADRMSAIFGVHSFVLSISMMVFGPLFGFIRDSTGSYPASTMAMGSSAGMGALLWCLMPAAVAYDKKIEEQQKKIEQEEIQRIV